MGFARTCSVALVGVEGVVVEVQADLEPGVAAFTLVGLPDKSLTESRDRVRAAVVNSGAEWPQKKLTVGLSPASVPKAGSGFDLAVACAVLGAGERIDPRVLADIVMIGELGLDGRVRPVRGILPAVLAAADAGYEQVVVPECAAAEAALVPGVSVLGVRSLRQLIAVLADEPVPEEEKDDLGRPDPLLAGLRVPGTGAATGMHSLGAAQQDHGYDLADVVGQISARTAVEVAAAGGHHLFLEGPPGAGKTMLAERLPGLLPPLTRQESLEVTAVHSVAGLLPPNKPLVDVAPYCAPHHSATMQALVGGGPHIARPGAVSLSHRGVLFLDRACKTGGQTGPAKQVRGGRIAARQRARPLYPRGRALLRARRGRRRGRARVYWSRWRGHSHGGHADDSSYGLSGVSLVTCTSRSSTTRPSRTRVTCIDSRRTGSLAGLARRAALTRPPSADGGTPPTGRRPRGTARAGCTAHRAWCPRCPPGDRTGRPMRLRSAESRACARLGRAGTRTGCRRRRGRALSPRRGGRALSRRAMSTTARLRCRRCSSARRPRRPARRSLDARVCGGAVPGEQDAAVDGARVVALVLGGLALVPDAGAFGALGWGWGRRGFSTRHVVAPPWVACCSA
jgi:energy-coupling factor transporter ATP-binding protein EcfA2